MIQNSQIKKGNQFTDERGTLSFNNEFDASEVKRIYFIENKTTAIVRAWQGHQIEKRWFTVVNGSFLVKLIKIDDWDLPSKKLIPEIYHLVSQNFEILHVPQGYASRIQSLEENSKLMVMGNYLLGETEDEYKYDQNYFEL